MHSSVKYKQTFPKVELVNHLKCSILPQYVRSGVLPLTFLHQTLTPTAITHSLAVTGLTGEGKSLVIAKPDRVEIWDSTTTGLVFRGDLPVWGTVVGLAVADVPVSVSTSHSTDVQDARPHLLVLVGPPNAQLHLVAWSPQAEGLVITSSLKLAPPTPALRQQQFFTAVISEGTTAIASLWTGLLTCVEMDFAKKGKKKDMEIDGDRKLVFKTSFNMKCAWERTVADLSIHEHNLLNLTFVPCEDSGNPVLTMLWMSDEHKILLQPRVLSLHTHSFTELAPRTDVVNPLELPLGNVTEPNFGEIDFSCPAGRTVLSLGAGPNGCRAFLVVGDEYAVMYCINPVPSSPKTAPKRSVKRSPRSEVGGAGKRRKSSQSGRSVTTDSEPRWSVQPVWRVRQGFGTILA